jgi:hypothetical protein
LVLAGWLRALGRTAVPVSAVAAGAWLAMRSSGVKDESWWALALLGIWLAATGVFAWWRRPAAFAALAVWDQAAGAREMLASAWWFEQTDQAGSGAELHLSRAREHLARRTPSQARDLPLRLTPRTWIAPLLFVALAFSGWLRPQTLLEDRALSAEARARATSVGKELAERARILDPLKSLTEEEKGKLKGLRAELQQTAEKLEQAKTPRDLLQDLEGRARDAEKLAEALRAEDPGALSPGFLSELERNADTADLGNALRSGDLGAAAEQARLLSARLGSRKPTLEEQKRLEEALKRALEAANRKDRESATGRHLSEAQKQLSGGNHGGAADQLGNLSRQLGTAAQRRQAQQQLRGLAQSFRGAGQQILGGQNLQRLMPQTPQGSQPLAGLPQLAPGAGNPGSPQGVLPLPIPGQGTPGGQMPLPVPGLGNPRSGMLFPIPGTGKPTPNAPSLALPGAGQNPGAGFPIPGLGGLPGAGMAAGGAGMNGAGVGGSEAGSGTAPLGSDPTNPLASNQTGVVAPVAGAEGPSDVRAVEGDSHREAPSRSRQELAVEFLKAEEAALAEEPLPLSRRDQVLRYFTAVRQQLEGQR